MKRFVYILLILLLASFAQAADPYWVDTDGGAANWAACQSATEPVDASHCTVAQLNTNVDAGNTVYIQGGSYSFGADVHGINPSNSGTNLTTGRIVIQAYDNETVTFTGSAGDGVAVNLQGGEDYIKIHGIDFSTWVQHLQLWGASYNEISNCSFIGMADTGSPTWSASELQEDSNYNWIHDCEFGTNGVCDNVDDDGVILDVGKEADGTDSSSYNLIEDSEFYQACHHTVGIHAKNNIFRNNYLHNEPWYTWDAQLWSGRGMQNGSSSTDAGPHLFEGNRIAYAGQAADALSGECIQHDTSDCIFRYNMFYQCTLSAMTITTYPNMAGEAQNNKIYNNVFWYNGYDDNNQSGETLFAGTWNDAYTHAIASNDTRNADCTGSTTPYSCCTGSGTGNCDVIDNDSKNNIYYQNDNELNVDEPYTIIISSSSCTAENTPYPCCTGFTTGCDEFPTYSISAGDWIGDTHGDPEFVSISGEPDPDDETQFDFSLQSGSGAIDNGVHLTDVASGDDCNGGSGCDTTVEVDDSTYFFDGWGIDDVWNTYGASVEEDFICITTVTNCAQIDSINYATDVITLKNAIDRDDGDDVWLQKKSDSVLVLVGSAPDQGAYEANFGATLKTGSNYIKSGGTAYIATP